MPPFEIAGGLGTAIVRGLSVAACLSVLGVSVFRLVVAPPAFASMQAEAAARLERWCLWLLRASAAAALLGSGLWLVLEAGDMIGGSTIGDGLAAVPLVIRHSRFGQVMVLRLALLVAVPIVSGTHAGKPGLAVAAVLAAVACASQAAFGHGASMGGAMEWLGLSTALHVLAAGIWLGQLLPLWMVVSKAPSDAANIALRRFSPVGLACILLLAFTASAQGFVLIGGIGRVFGTAYGWVDLAKLLLFATLVAFAAANRFAMMPKLAAGGSTSLRRMLSLSVFGEVILGLLVILAAGLLTSLPPGMHQQALWPFGWRPSLVAMSEPALRQEIVGAAVMAAGAVILVGVAMALHRLRWVAVLIAIVLLGLAAPHFRPLFVEAYPTSYFVSPSGFTASAIAHGADLFKANCVSCHGDQGRGDGPKAKSLAVPPADLTAEHLWEHADGELFWWLSHGMEGPDGELVMPGFAAKLSEGDRWDLIDFIHANNARARGIDSHSVEQPAGQGHHHH